MTSGRILAAVTDAFRRSFPQLLAYTILFNVASLAVLAPLSAWVLTLLISSTGHVAVGNEEIVRFFLTPTGSVTLLLLGTGALFAGFTEQAGLMVISAAALGSQKSSSVSAVRLTLKAIPTLLGLGLRQIALYLCAVAPFLAVAGITYWTLWSGHNINFLLHEKPPVFWVGGGIAVVLLLGAGVVCAMLYVRWTFSVPYCLFESRSPGQALADSRQLVQGAFFRVAAVLLAWVALIAAVGSVTFAVFDFLSEVLLASLGERLTLVLPAVAILVVVHVLLLGAFSFLGLAVNCLLITRLFYNRRRDKGEAVSAIRPAHWPDEAARDRRWFGSRGAVWAGAAIVVLLATAASLWAIERLDISHRVLVTAHRGSSLHAPENTLSAIRRAIDDGADFAEIDVQETSDGVVVVLHDDDFKRVAGVDKKIWETSFDELRRFDAGSWFSPEFAGERIPTLAEVIAEAKGRIRLNVELKFNGHDEKLAERTIEVIRESNFESDCIVTSLDYDGLMRAKMLDDRLRVGYIIFQAVGDVSRLDVELLSVRDRFATAGLVTAARRRGKAVHVWTVNDPKAMSSFMDLGVESIITDDAAALVALRDERDALSDTERVLLSFRHWLAR